ncbi:site-2 protease family protein [Phenylobacterium aquaticum]|uniref:site-2 protease family protein n=1 Tax=Phenylobacterium aquaticum TaxID=1763816 RepID=UPI0026F07794|nr:site-2 protease family protein [Phenylobacterium aquaticum]
MSAIEARPRRGGLHLFGVEIRINLSWLVAALLIGSSLASGAFPQLYAGLPPQSYLAMAGIAVLGLAVSIVLHELSHTLVGRAFGMRIDRITLFFFGGVAELRDEPHTPLSELAMAIAGPAFSLVFGLVLAVVAGALHAMGASVIVINAVTYLAGLNIILAVFNLAPAFPLDGGRVLRALLWLVLRRQDTATRTALAISEGLALLLMGAGLVVAVRGEVAGGLWWVIMGWFLRASGRAERASLRRGSAGGVEAAREG